MKESLFRKKSIDGIASPEEIDDYIKVTSPGMWMVFCAVLLLLAAIFIWSITGRIKSNMLVDGQVVTEEIAPIELLID